MIINYGSREENEKIFNNLLKNKKIIEEIFGGELVWNILGGKKSCRISTWIEGVNIRNTTDWDKMVDYQCEVMVRFEKALRDKVKEAAKIYNILILNYLKNLTSNARKCYNNNNIKLTFKSVL